MKVAVLGCGIMGRTHAKNYAAMPGAELVGVCDAEESLAQKLAESCGTKAYREFAAMLQDARPEVVSICLPTHLHKPYVIAAARAGIHVICEKPIAPSLTDAEEMIRVCGESGVRLFIAHVVRFFPSYADLARKVAQGAIGKVGVAHTKRAGGHPGLAKPWYFDESLSGGVILDLLIHDIDFMRSVLGEVASVYAMNRVQEQTDYALVTLRFRSGAIANLEGYWGYPGPFMTAVELAGDKGVLRFNSNDVNAVRLLKSASGEGSGGRKQVAVPKSPAYHDPYYYELQHFIECIGSGAEAVVTAADAYKAMEIAFAAKESARTGRPVGLGAAEAAAEYHGEGG